MLTKCSWPWIEILGHVFHVNEGYGVVSWVDLQRYLSSVHNDQDTDNLPWLRYANNHPWDGHQASSVPRQIKRWSIQKRIKFISLSVKNWGRRMCMKPTCTRSKILLWVRQMINYRISQHLIPPSRRSRQSNTPLGTWWL